MPFQIDYQSLLKLLAPVLVAAVAAWARRYFEGRAKLVTYLVHAASNPLPPPTPPLPTQGAAAPRGADEGPLGASAPLHQSPAAPRPPPSPVPPGAPTIHTHAIVVRNAGQKTAHNVRIDHAVMPLSFGVHPPIRHELTRQGDGAEILFPVLVPGEQVTISYLYFAPLTWDRIQGWVKCDEGMARAVNVIPSTPLPKGVRWLLAIFTFIGASTVVYKLLQLLAAYLS